MPMKVSRRDLLTSAAAVAAFGKAALAQVSG